MKNETNKQFGISGEGWSNEDLMEVLEVFDYAQKIRYEIENCRRGEYAQILGVPLETVEDMLEALEVLRYGLDEAIETIQRETEED